MCNTSNLPGCVTLLASLGYSCFMHPWVIPALCTRGLFLLYAPVGYSRCSPVGYSRCSLPCVLFPLFSHVCVTPSSFCTVCTSVFPSAQCVPRLPVCEECASFSRLRRVCFVLPSAKRVTVHIQFVVDCSLRLCALPVIICNIPDS